MSQALLVTGASGFLGRQLCTQLVSQKYLVKALHRGQSVNNVPGCQNITAAGIESWHDNSAALQGVRAVIHLAARVHVMHDAATNPLEEFRKVNVHGTLHLARQAAAAGVKRFVFISTAKVNGESTALGAAFTENNTANPQDPYALSKYEAEQGLQQITLDTGMAVVIIRPPLVYGPGVRANFAALMRAVQRGWPLPLGAVHNQRSLIGLDNLVNFIILCVTHPAAANQIFLVSDGHDLSTTELVRSMAQVAGVADRLLPVPVSLLQVAGKCLGKTKQIERLCGNLQLNISKARTLLNWVPPVSVQEGLRLAMAKTTA